jgi:ribosome biogenesis protein SSF1/2
MNNFSTSSQGPATSSGGTPAVPKHLETLVTTIFQSVFPPLNPQATPLTSIKRVLLLNREPPSDPSNNAYTISLRHYAITTRKSGLNRPIKRINQADKGDKNERKGRGVPNLGRMGDVSEFLLGGENGTNEGSYTSASETETDTDGEVEVTTLRTRKLLGRKEREKARENGASKSADGTTTRGVEKRAVKLTELGPRMRLRLIKVEEGLCGGKIMWHDHISRSKAEEREMEEKWETRRKEKEERKRVQRENVERKKAAKTGKRGASGKDGEEGGEGEDSGDEEMEYDVEDDEYWQDEDDESGEEVDGDEDDKMEEG